MATVPRLSSALSGGCLLHQAPKQVPLAIFRSVSTQVLQRADPLVRVSLAHSSKRKTFSRVSSTVTRRHESSDAKDSLRQTPLHSLHVANSAKLVPFGGFSMPVSYKDLSLGESHAWTRTKASLFDVSHMVQQRFSGPGALAFLQRITPASLTTLGINHSTLSMLLHPVTGGIVDDTVITKLGPELFYVVTNAACRGKDGEYLAENLSKWSSEGGEKVHWEVLEGWGLVALQGPLSADILGSIIYNPDESDLKEFYFGQSKFLKLKSRSGEAMGPVLASRGGYTGEDGFEISIPPEESEKVTQLLLDTAGPDKLRLAGLGARDSLRLEAGMCLYGHDLDDTTTPVEAALGWTVGKDRRAEGGFYGDDVILRQLRPIKDGGSGVTRRRVGFVVEGAPAREGAEVVDESGNAIGNITSGCPSPTLGKNIAMGYIKNGLHKSGTVVSVVVRGKSRKAVVSKMPFVPSKYFKPAASPA